MAVHISMNSHFTKPFVEILLFLCFCCFLHWKHCPYNVFAFPAFFYSELVYQPLPVLYSEHPALQYQIAIQNLELYLHLLPVHHIPALKEYRTLLLLLYSGSFKPSVQPLITGLTQGRIIRHIYIERHNMSFEGSVLLSNILPSQFCRCS